MSLSIGSPAPDFSLPTTDGQTLCLTRLKGRPFVLYFYPRADTPGCTQEACDFQTNLPDFSQIGVMIIGVSKDNMKALEKFADKYKLTFPLASDPDATTINNYGAWQEKSMYGKKYMGIERSTVLIDSKGIIAKHWPKVKIKGHAEEVLQAVRDML